jgi:hypothetical protein
MRQAAYYTAPLFLGGAAIVAIVSAPMIAATLVLLRGSTAARRSDS